MMEIAATAASEEHRFSPEASPPDIWPCHLRITGRTSAKIEIDETVLNRRSLMQGHPD